MTYFWVGIGSAIGGMARFWLTIAVATVVGGRFPWGTMLINVSGSFIIGWFGALTAAGGRLDVPQDIRIFVMVGICGGFTTFSSFSLQSLELLRTGDIIGAGANIIGSVLLCLLAVWAGTLLGR
jgi:CrcB protein